MLLRKWQSECINTALKHYRANRHFLCLATPGAGKTTMAVELAHELWSSQQIDFVFAFSPSVNVSGTMQIALENRFNRTFHGQIGALGTCITYHSLCYLDDEFFEILTHYRVMVIFDEIHHCGGDSLDNANTWGREILEHLSEQAAFTLALTGTPWRSNNQAIVLTQYCEITRKVICDYEYGLAQAVADNVCRKPNIVLIDNELVTLQENGKAKQTYGSLQALLSSGKGLYRLLLHKQDAVKFMLDCAIKRLRSLRRNESTAAGLIVASSVQHAHQVVSLLMAEFGISAELVTCHAADAQAKIEQFRCGSQEWIVSVGMISEGTDIPRLQVCCHLSAIKTEMYYRQVLGRILRQTSNERQDAWFYTFTEPTLVKYAGRIKEDLPDEYQVITSEGSNASVEFNPASTCSTSSSALLQNPIVQTLAETPQITLNGQEPSYLSRAIISMTGRFHEQVLIAFESPFQNYQLTNSNDL